MITMTGTSGIDVSGIIQQLTALKQLEVTRISDRRATVNRQLDAFSRMGSQMSELQSRANALGSIRSFDQFKATSSNDSAVGIRTFGNVSAGLFSVEVMQLAQREKLGSGENVVKDSNEALGMSGTFSINGIEIIVAETDTLNDLRLRINNASSTDENGKVTRTDVVASIIRAGDDDFRLVLTSNEAGAKGIELKDVSGDILQNLGFLDNDGVKTKALVDGQDARFRINGIEMTSNSNTISDRIAGMTFDLKAVTESPVNITVARDEAAITENVAQLIQSFNAMLRFERDQTSFTPGEGKDRNGNDNPPTKGALFGDSTARNVNAGLRAIFQRTVNYNGQQVSLAHFGITTDPQTGELRFNRERFGEMLKQDFDGVVGIFATSGVSSNDRISLGRNTAATQEGTYELREVMVERTRQVAEMVQKLDDDENPVYENGEPVMVQAKDPDGTLRYEDETYNERTFQIRLRGAYSDPEAGWVNGTRNGEIVSFSVGPANGLMITAPAGSGGLSDTAAVGDVSGEISTLTFSRGLAGAVEDHVRQLNDSIDGVVARKRESLNSRIRTIDSQIDMAQRRVDAYNARLVLQFARMEQTMMLMQSQQTAMFSQLPNLNQQRN